MSVAQAMPFVQPYIAAGNVRGWLLQNHGLQHHVKPVNHKTIITTQDQARALLQHNALLKQRLKQEPAFAAKSAKEKADHCRHLFADLDAHLQPESVLAEQAKLFVEASGLEMIKSRFGWLPVRLRLEDQDWWNRQIKKMVLRRNELARLTRVGIRYCSDELLTKYVESKKTLRSWIERSYLEGDNGEQIELAKVVDSSVANQGIRKKELIARIKGLEQMGDDLHHVCKFITVTAPSKYHPVSGKYQGFSPKQTQDYLVKVWSRVRAALHRRNINMYGLRVVEPHTDACPHWHLALFFESKKQGNIATKLLRDYFMAEDKGEKGALMYRVKTKTIDKGKEGTGGLVAYMLKYLSKNIDGEGVNNMTDVNGNLVTDGSDGAMRVCAWASCWGVRQFQFLGVPAIGIWRQLRRIRDAEKIPESMRDLWSAADSGDYYGYIKAYRKLGYVGLIKYGLEDELKKLADKLGADNITDDDLLKTGALNKYLEPVSKVIGIETRGDELITKKDIIWTIKTSEKAESTDMDIMEKVNTYLDLCAEKMNGLYSGFWDDVFGFSVKLPDVVGGGRKVSGLWDCLSQPEGAGSLGQVAITVRGH